MQKASSELKKFLDRKAFNKKAETSGAAALSIGDLIYDGYLKQNKLYTININSKSFRQKVFSYR